MYLSLDQKVGTVLPHSFNSVENVSPPDRMDLIAAREQSRNRVAPDEA
jgi:hypothetical protein